MADMTYGVRHFEPDPEPTVVIVAGQHGDEPEGVALAQAIVRQWKASEDPEFQMVVFGAANPWGLARGVRQSEYGIDRNRVWSRSNPYDALGAEVWTVLAEPGPVLLLDLHSTSTPIPFIYVETADHVERATRLFRHMAPMVDSHPGTLTAEAHAAGLEAYTVEAARHEPLAGLPRAVFRACAKWSRRVQEEGA